MKEQDSDPLSEQQLRDAGLLTGESDALSLTFSNEFFTTSEAVAFDAYLASIAGHEHALARRRDHHEDNQLSIRVLDQKRSRLHDSLAKVLQAELPIPGWDHEQYRRWIAAMARASLPWLNNKALVADPSTIRKLASLPGIDPSTPSRAHLNQ